MPIPHHHTRQACRSTARAGAFAASLALSAVVAAGPAATPAFAQAQPQVNIQVQTQAKQIWPALNENQVYWYEPNANLPPAAVDAVLRQAVGEVSKYRSLKDETAICTIKKLSRQTKSNVAGLKVEGRWQFTTGKKDRSGSVFVPLDTMNGVDLWYITRATTWKWNVQIGPAPVSIFHFASEATARRFIDALVSARSPRAAALWPRPLGIWVADLGPEQAQDAGRSRVEGVLVQLVKIGGPADLGGLQALDVILEYNNAAVLNQDQFYRLVDQSVGSVPVTVLRRIKAPEGTKPSYTWERKTLTITVRK